MRKILFMMLCTLSVVACAKDNKQIITFDQLPQPAQTIIATYSNDEPIAIIVVEKGLTETEYEVRFSNGNEWKFDGEGAVESLDNKVKALPEALIPGEILSYVDRYFVGQYIREYSVDRRDYEVTLSSGIELKFDKSFQLIKTDLD